MLTASKPLLGQSSKSLIRAIIPKIVFVLLFCGAIITVATQQGVFSKSEVLDLSEVAVGPAGQVGENSGGYTKLFKTLQLDQNTWADGGSGKKAAIFQVDHNGKTLNFLFMLSPHFDTTTVTPLELAEALYTDDTLNWWEYWGTTEEYFEMWVADIVSTNNVYNLMKREERDPKPFGGVCVVAYEEDPKAHTSFNIKGAKPADAQWYITHVGRYGMEKAMSLGVTIKDWDKFTERRAKQATKNNLFQSD